MAQNVTIAGIVYSSVPSILLTKTSGGTASFVDTSDGTATAADVASGKTCYVGGSKISGTASSGGGGGGGGSLTIKEMSATLTKTSSAVFSGLSGSPEFFVVQPNVNFQLSTTSRYIVNVNAGDSTTHVTCAYGSGNRASAMTTTNAGWSYSGGRLTVSTTAASNGVFYSGSYRLMYGYIV